MDDKEARTEYVVQQLDRDNEAKGRTIAAQSKMERQVMSPEERARQVQADNDALFGME